MKLRIKYLVLLILATTGCTSIQPPSEQATASAPSSSASAPVVAATAVPAPATTTLVPDVKARRAAADMLLFRSERLRASVVENAFYLQDELKHRKYAVLESQLDASQAKYLSDPGFELVMQDIATFAEGSSVVKPVSKEFIDAWLSARPDSAWAHYAEGLRWSKKAWNDRGSGLGPDVTDEQWRMVRADEAQARSELHEALDLNPKMVMAWLTLMDVDQTDPNGGLADVSRDYSAGAAQLPSSLLLADRYMQALQPRWFGSSDMMANFATSKLMDLDKNPRFWELQGNAPAYAGCTSCVSVGWDDSLRHYDAALAFEDRPSWLVAAGEAALRLHRFGLAREYYVRANAYKPGNITWTATAKFLSDLCDPASSTTQLELERKDAIEHKGLADVDYSRQAGDCSVLAADLPWGDEPIPDVGALHPYLIGPHFAVPAPAPVRAADFPGTTTELESPDSRYIVRSVDTQGRHELRLEDSLTGHGRGIYAYTLHAHVVWNDGSNRLAITDAETDPKTKLNSSDCFIFNIGTSREFVDVLDEFKKHLEGFNAEVAGKQVFLGCQVWYDPNIVLINLTTWSPTTNVSPVKLYRYKVENGDIVEWKPGASKTP